MKTLSKTHKTQIDTMIKSGDKINWIKAYCDGSGIDTSVVSSIVYIHGQYLTIRYRGINYYHSINH